MSNGIAPPSAVTAIPEITEFMPSGDGTRRRSFRIYGCEVQVCPSYDGCSDDNARTFTLALAIKAAGHAAQLFRLESDLATAEGRLATVQHDLAIAQSRIPPTLPARLLGDGFIRFDLDSKGDGRMWLLNRRDRGFGEFGVIVDGWDDLFRRYNVRVTGHGVDEHGAWWAVSPIAEGK